MFSPGGGETVYPASFSLIDRVGLLVKRITFPSLSNILYTIALTLEVLIMKNIANMKNNTSKK